MTAILSEISNHLSISAFKDKFTEISSNINDKIVKVQEALSNKSEKPEEKKPEEKKPEEKKPEAYEAPPTEKTTKDKIIDFLVKVKDYSIIAISTFFRIAFYILLASLVANDMIMYSPIIRAFFFCFTLFVTYVFPLYKVIIALYYILKKGYDYYHQNLSSEKVKPPKSFPMFFAILPLTTKYPESPVARFFMWPFMYQKSDKPDRIKKENDRLQVIMETYWKDLNTSFDYLDQIKTSEPFSRLYEINKEHLTVDYMHPIQKPETVVVASKTLPDIIGEKTEEKKTLFPPQSKDQANKEATPPPVTQSSENSEMIATAISAIDNKPSASSTI